MKKLLALPLILGLSLFATAVPAHAQVKVGVVDMDKVFKSYYKTKDAETTINDARSSAKKELDDRMADYSKELDGIKKLEEELSRPELSKASKDDKSKQRDEKIAHIRSTEREIKEFQASREKDLQSQAIRMRNKIVEEIQELIQKEVKADGFSLVLDKSGSSLNGVPIILYSNSDWDFSDKIITELNKNRSSAAPAATAPAATAPAATTTPAATTKKK
jgi:outer membrane protein